MSDVWQAVASVSWPCQSSRAPRRSVCQMIRTPGPDIPDRVLALMAYPWPPGAEERTIASRRSPEMVASPVGKRKVPGPSSRDGGRLLAPARGVQRAARSVHSAAGGAPPVLGVLRRFAHGPAAVGATNLEVGSVGATRAPLIIGRVNDAAERQADHVARAIGTSGPPAHGDRIPDPSRVRSPAGTPFGVTPVARESEAAGPAREAATAPPIVHAALSSPGRPLSGPERAFFEPRLGRDFSQVRIHTGPLAVASADAVNARAYAVGHRVVLGDGQADQRVLAHELTHVAQQAGGLRPLLRRQEKTIGGPLDLKPDPCITAPGVGTVCGQAAVSACEKFPGIPGCSLVCSLFGCKKDDTPKTLCKPGWRVSTGTEFKGQCCKEATDDAQTCCPPDRIAWADDKCCADGEVVSNDQHCVSSQTLPFTPLPERQEILDKFCKDFPNLCKPQPDQDQGPSGPVRQLGILWTNEIHFEQDQPGRGGGAVLTSEGTQELESVLSWLRISPDLEVRLIGSASWEGPKGTSAEYNQALGARRVAYILKALGGFSSRVADPFIGDGAESGCQALGPGRWSCGSANAPPGTARPEDRVVRVTFSRNKLTLSPLKLEMPSRLPRHF